MDGITITPFFSASYILMFAGQMLLFEFCHAPSMHNHFLAN